MIYDVLYVCAVLKCTHLFVDFHSFFPAWGETLQVQSPLAAPSITVSPPRVDLAEALARLGAGPTPASR